MRNSKRTVSRRRRYLLPPALMPAMKPTVTRWLSLLLVAFAVSLLAGFGTVVMSHNLGTRRI